MPADITLVNLNMLYMRYATDVERELHVPLGCLYLTKALRDAGFDVDFRDYQTCEADDVFNMDVFLRFVEDPAPVIGLSCMANLLPFAILAFRALRTRYPNATLVLGGVGSASVDNIILTRFPWIDIIHRGEGERQAPQLLKALKTGGDLSAVPGITYRNRNGQIVRNPNAPRIEPLDSIPFPAFDEIDLKSYAGYGMMTSRGCPYPCTFCSVAPIWELKSCSRSPENIVAEMKLLNETAGVKLFLFQDEFFISTRKHVLGFCDALDKSGLDIKWKAFGRVNLTDETMMRAMAATGCVELRFGIESGSDRILERIRKGFTTRDVMEIIPKAIEIFPRTDAFYIWGFPFETLDDFNQTLFQMISFRMLGARILPSLLSILPQTEIYKDYATSGRLEFCPWLLPEFVFTGCEIWKDGEVAIPDEHSDLFGLIRANPDIFPGFFHIDLEANVLPKLKLLREFGFYPDAKDAESCGAHSPSVESVELATRAGD